MLPVDAIPPLVANPSTVILATAVGLLMNALEQQEKNQVESVEPTESVVAEDQNDGTTSQSMEPNPLSSNRKTILDRWVEKFKEFLDNA